MEIQKQTKIPFDKWERSKFKSIGKQVYGFTLEKVLGNPKLIRIFRENIEFHHETDPTEFRQFMFWKFLGTEGNVLKYDLDDKKCEEHYVDKIYEILMEKDSKTSQG